MHKLVLGLGFGDEGKGLTVDWLCAKSPNPLVIRFNGGHQAGHTVIHNGVRHVFSNFGSGTLQGAPTYWSKFCTVEPIGLLNELAILREKGVEPKLYIDSHCPITTPYEIHHNRYNNPGHGTVGVGFGATIQREEAFYSLTFLDLFYPAVLKAKLEAIFKYYCDRKILIPDDVQASIATFNKACALVVAEESIELVKDVQSLYKSQPTLIFEGAQGLLLDQRHGFFPNVTRSNTGTKNVLKIWKQFFNYAPKLEIFMVTRAYQTRHGVGFMSNVDIEHKIAVNPIETNITHTYQGEFKRTLLDVSLLEYAIQKDSYLRTAFPKHLVVTCLDHVKDDYRFTYNGEISAYTNQQDFLLNLNNILDSQGISEIYLSQGAEGKQIKKW